MLGTIIAIVCLFLIGILLKWLLLNTIFLIKCNSFKYLPLLNWNHTQYSLWCLHVLSATHCAVAESGWEFVFLFLTVASCWYRKKTEVKPNLKPWFSDKCTTGAPGNRWYTIPSTLLDLQAGSLLLCRVSTEVFYAQPANWILLAMLFLFNCF